MLDQETIRADVEQLARKILSQKLWPIQEAAIFLGYSPGHMRQKVTTLEIKRNLVVLVEGGARKLYAADILELLEENTGMTFPELRSAWFRKFGLTPPSGKSSNGETQSRLL